MGFIDTGLAGYGSVSLGSLTTTGANETLRATTPNIIPASLRQGKMLTERAGPGEVWVPLGIAYIITTGITVTPVVLTLRKNGVNAATNGTITLPIAALGPNEIWANFNAGGTPSTANYTFAAADAMADAWSLFVTTTSTAGVVSIRLIYAWRAVIGISTGVVGD